MPKDSVLSGNLSLILDRWRSHGPVFPAVIYTIHVPRTRSKISCECAHHSPQTLLGCLCCPEKIHSKVSVPGALPQNPGEGIMSFPGRTRFAPGSIVARIRPCTALGNDPSTPRAASNVCILYACNVPPISHNGQAQSV